MLAECDLVDLCRRLVRLHAAQAQERFTELTAGLPQGAVTVRVDAGQLEQVLVNVLRNAFEAVGEYGRVEVRVRNEDPGILLEVLACGPGLSDEDAENLFTPSFSTKPRGQGIGLTLVREILALLEFDWALESPPGGPTRFWIRFSVVRTDH